MTKDIKIDSTRMQQNHLIGNGKEPLCCNCQYCGDKYSFPEPNDLIYMDPKDPLLKHFYCCCGDCDLYSKDITGLGIHECEHFEEL